MPNVMCWAATGVSKLTASAEGKPARRFSRASHWLEASNLCASYRVNTLAAWDTIAYEFQCVAEAGAHPYTMLTWRASACAWSCLPACASLAVCPNQARYLQPPTALRSSCCLLSAWAAAAAAWLLARLPTIALQAEKHCCSRSRRSSLAARCCMRCRSAHQRVSSYLHTQS